MPIPVSVIIVTKNEEKRIGACLEALQDFAEIIVVDSASTDKTPQIAASRHVRVENFIWNGAYPKKRQWCLDTLRTAHDWIFFVDADEIVTPALAAEIAALDFSAPGYFVPGQYVFEGKALKFGLRNSKLALLDRRKMAFPVIDDLDMPGMGEIEGHYQPMLKPHYRGERPARLRSTLLHDAYADTYAPETSGWQARHERYAAWERAMNDRKAWPGDITPARRLAKALFRALPARGTVAFLHSYVWKLGFLDGARGFRFALSRKRYYGMI